MVIKVIELILFSLFTARHVGPRNRYSTWCYHNVSALYALYLGKKTSIIFCWSTEIGIPIDWKTKGKKERIAENWQKCDDSNEKGNGWTKVHIWLIERKARVVQVIEKDREKYPKSSLQLFISVNLTSGKPHFSFFPPHSTPEMLMPNMNWCHIFLVHGVWKTFDLDIFFSSFYRRHKWQLMTFNISGIRAIKVYFFGSSNCSIDCACSSQIHMSACVWSDTLF